MGCRYDLTELKPLLPKVHGRRRLRQQGILCLPLANYLRVHPAEVSDLGRKLGVLTKRWDDKNQLTWITWQGAEKIILIVRARQGAEEIARIESRSHITSPSRLRR